MSAVPPAFRRQFLSHNLHAAGMALAALVAAIVLWNLAYFFFVVILLGLTTAVHGDFGPTPPGWIGGTALTLAVALVVWGLLDRAWHRYDLPPDRAVVGWHLIPDILLLPVRTTLAIRSNLQAMVTLRASEVACAWDVLQAIHRAGKAPISGLTLIESRPARLDRALTALQLTGCIDLHRGEQSWFYTVRSSFSENLNRMLAGPAQS